MIGHPTSISIYPAKNAIIPDIIESGIHVLRGMLQGGPIMRPGSTGRARDVKNRVYHALYFLFFIKYITGMS